MEKVRRRRPRGLGATTAIGAVLRDTDLELMDRMYPNLSRAQQIECACVLVHTRALMIVLGGGGRKNTITSRGARPSPVR